VIPLKSGKWIPVSGTAGQALLLVFFTVTVAVYGAQHGVHGIAAGDLAPTGTVFIAVAPVLLFSFSGAELPAAAAEEMTDPRRDIPAAIGQAGAALIVMYAVPVLAVLIVLPAGAVTSLHGFLDALTTVLTVYGESAGDPGGTPVLTGAGQVAGWACAALFIWVLMASAAAWIMGSGRAQAAACLDGAGPRFLGRVSARTGVPARIGLLTGVIAVLVMAAGVAVTGQDNQKYFSAALTAVIALVVLAYLLVFPAFAVLRRYEPGLRRPFLVPGGRAGAAVVTIAATGWSALAAACLLWPGLGMAHPDVHLPAGFAGQRGLFELLVLAPVAVIVAAATAYCLATRHRNPAPSHREEE
jgi:amino acid transporter